MNTEKLELKHIAPYLPYELQMAYIVRDEIVEIGSLDKVFIYIDATYKIRYGINNNDVEHEWMFKPFLRSLSSMTKEEAYEFGVLLLGEAEMEDKEVGIGGMAVMEDMYPPIMYKDQEDEDYSVIIQFSSIGVSMSGIDLIPHEAYEWLFSKHFDIFGLIDKGLAIDINSVVK